MSGPEENRPAFLAVTNTGKIKFRAKFHGEGYEWLAGETVNLTVEAARHIFGFGLDDKSAAFLRSGWINTRPDGTVEDAERRLAEFTFAPVKQMFGEVRELPAKKKVKATDDSPPAAVAGAEEF